MQSWRLFWISLGAVPLILFGILAVVNGVVGCYMVGYLGVPPGQPIYLDELATSLASNIWELVVGIACIALGLWARSYVRAKRRAAS